MRGYDTVAYDIDSVVNEGGDMVARMGGDEFMLIITSLEGVARSIRVAERVREAVLEPIVIDDTELEIGVSIGIAIYPEDGETAEELVVNADLAMYEAKNSGKNSYRLFRSDMQAAAKRNLEIESSLRNALNNNELALHYQPKFDINTGEVVGAEALLRWHNDKLGEVSPSSFIPVAECSSLIFDIDEWVLHAACKQINAWQKAGMRMVPVAMNVSAKQAARVDLIGKVHEVIEDFSLPHGVLELEITETSAIANMSVVAENIRTLKEIGVTVALDDFGAGHSSLSLLRYCDIDTLKIDRAFVEELSQPEGKPIFKAVISLAKVLNVATVAEGIEQQHELEAIRSFGCGVAQGFLLAKPMTAREFETFVNAQNSIRGLFGAQR